MFSAKDLFFTPTVSAAYQVTKSLRFRSSATAYLSRTPGSAGDRQKWTWSGWVKRGLISGSSNYTFFAATAASPTDDTNLFGMAFNNDTLYIGGGANNWITTTAVYRDPSAWYHIVLAVDTTSATTTITGGSTDRVRLYVNGAQVSAFSATTAPALNLQTAVNSTVQHDISGVQPFLTRYFDGYVAEVNFIGGSALDASSFGAYDTNGVWQPKAYTGSYSGTNSYYLKFTDTTSTTTLCYDYSGNSNNWTPNNISLTSGTTYDSMLDSPTNYADSGNGRGNYATLNPLWKQWAGTPTVTNGNMTFTGAATTDRIAATISATGGKYYFEVTKTDANAIGNNLNIGVANSTAALSTTTYSGNPTNAGATANEWILTDRGYACNTSTYTNLSGTIGTVTQNSVVQVCVDTINGLIWWGKNNTFSGSPSAGTGAAFSNLPSSVVPVICTEASGYVAEVNFGQRPFTYTPPSGFSALNTQNMTTPTITNGASYMAAVTFAGNSSSSNTITTSSTNSGNNPLPTTFQPDFVWIKNRTNAYNHTLVDVVRGGSLYLESNTTTGDQSAAVVSSFNSDGFTIGTSSIQVNGSSNNYIGWQWKAGNSSGSTNTSGSITSTVSVNQTAGFSVVKYTGNATANATVGHGLGAAPSMIIVKDLSNAYNWTVYHASLAAGYVLVLNSTGAAVNSPEQFTTTAPTSSVFYLGWPGSANNTNATTSHIAYCFAPVTGYSSFGTYTGNGSSDGPFVYTGFRPRWIMLKGNSASGWEMYDTSRDTYNVGNKYIMANSSGVETTTATIDIDILSNGFKLRGSGSDMNGSGVTFYYMAFAENPFTISRAR